MRRKDIKMFEMSTIKTKKDLRTQYMNLCKQFHPDLNGDETIDTMKSVNNEYEYLNTNFFKLFDIETDENGRDVNYHDNADINNYKGVSQDFILIIQSLIKYDHIIIELIGSWLWVSNTTYEDTELKELLKSFGFTWSRNRKKWSLGQRSKKSWSSKKSFDELKNEYGCTRFNDSQKQQKQIKEVI